MKIGVDISQVSFSGTGVARYTKRLIEALLEIKDNSYIFFFSSLRGKVPEDVASLIQKAPLARFVEYKIPPSGLHLLWNVIHRVSIDRLIGEVDLFITSDWTEPPLRNGKKITIIHDMVVYKYPETTTNKTTFDISKAQLIPNIKKTLFLKHNWVKKESNHILADSQATKEDIVSFFGTNPNDITVVYPSVLVPHPSQTQLSHIRKKYGIKRSFILAVGKLEPRKNIPLLIQAYTKIVNPPFDLYIAGSKGWEAGSNLEIPPTHSDKIHFLGFISDADLYGLYALADLFVFPSSYEGFGFPIIEAMSLGCPVLTSNISSMKELAEGYAVLCDPTNINDIKGKIENIMSDSSLRKELTKKGLVRAKDFSKEKYVEKLKEVFKAISD
ncbi:MAG: glycosyltransferase family 4 protein [Candidatus Roizmanbacteria bacterium]